MFWTTAANSENQFSAVNICQLMIRLKRCVSWLHSHPQKSLTCLLAVLYEVCYIRLQGTHDMLYCTPNSHTAWSFLYNICAGESWIQLQVIIHRVFVSCSMRSSCQTNHVNQTHWQVWQPLCIQCPCKPWRSEIPSGNTNYIMSITFRLKLSINYLSDGQKSTMSTF